jgi:hypothetical protein
VRETAEGASQTPAAFTVIATSAKGTSMPELRRDRNADRRRTSKPVAHGSIWDRAY